MKARTLKAAGLSSLIWCVGRAGSELKNRTCPDSALMKARTLKAAGLSSLIWCVGRAGSELKIRKRVTGLVELDQFKYTLNTYREPFVELRDSL